MDKNLVQPFLDAACCVLETEANVKARPVSVTMVKSPLTCRDMTVVIGVAGGLRGIVALNMHSAVVRALVERMAGGLPVDADGMLESAMGEVANMITGRAATALSKGGVQIVISPPTILTSAGESYLTLPGAIFGIGLGSDCGDIEIDVSFAAPVCAANDGVVAQKASR